MKNIIKKLKKSINGAAALKSAGGIGELAATGICIMAMTVIVVSYFGCIELVLQKTKVGQLAREYILRMETVGYLTADDQTNLLRELEEIGVTGGELGDTTTQPAGYGQRIVLDISGKLRGEYEFNERRVSTAKY
ncbi:MAG: hypothetical protein LUG83_00325 [Lachnospiraceae bacterium]|nr:hypothetical protein [Lachnospiraceae bacterium]